MNKLFGVLTAAAVFAAHGSTDGFAQTVEERDVKTAILTAWDSRCHKVQSFQLVCALTQIQMVASDASLNMFDASVSGEQRPVELNSKFKLISKGDKILMTSDGEEWDGATLSHVPRLYSRCFDGKNNTALLEGESLSFPLALLNNERNAAGELTINTHYVPLWMSICPSAVLTWLKFDCSKINVADLRSFHQGRPCIEVTIPRHPMYCSVYVDPSLGYLPVKYVDWRDAGKIRLDIEIEYQANEVLGWVISKWTSNVYGANDDVETSLSGNIEDVQINQPISDAVFNIELPIGTHIRETLDGTTRHLIQESNGARQELKRATISDSSITTSRLPLVATAVLVVVLAVATIVKRTRAKGD